MKNQKTYVFNSKGDFLRARPTKMEAILSTKEKGCFFFSQDDVKKGRHTKSFKKLKKYSM
jgi:hypothetical protein